MHKLGSFGTPIIMEFYANLSKDIGDPATSSFGKTMVQGFEFEFYPKVINQFWECQDPSKDLEVPEVSILVSTLTAGQLKKWTKRHFWSPT